MIKLRILWKLRLKLKLMNLLRSMLKVKVKPLDDISAEDKNEMNDDVIGFHSVV